MVGNTYLLCRIVDTIEDAVCIDPKTKQVLSTLFVKTVLDSSYSEKFVKESLIALLNHPNHDEKDLIKNIPRVLRVLQSFDEKQRHAVAQCVQIMSEGMSYFHVRQNQAGLEDLKEFEKYCYVVAGVVGEMLTTVFALHSAAFAKANCPHIAIEALFDSRQRVIDFHHSFHREDAQVHCILLQSQEKIYQRLMMWQLLIKDLMQEWNLITQEIP